MVFKFKEKPFMKWTGNEISVTGYILSFLVLVISLVIAGYAFNSDTYGLSNLVYTQYNFVFFTLFLTTLQGRISRHETKVVQVSFIYTYTYNILTYIHVCTHSHIHFLNAFYIFIHIDIYTFSPIN